MTYSLSYVRLPEIMKVAPVGHDKKIKKKKIEKISVMLSKVQLNALFPHYTLCNNNRKSVTSNIPI